MMKKISIVSALLFALPVLATTSVLAADDAANTPFYVGASVGKSNFKFDCSADFSCTNPGANFKLLAGYQFSPNFAVEGAYLNFGTVKASSDYLKVEGRIQSLTLAGVGIIPLSDEAKLFGKLGMHYSHAKLDMAYPYEGISSSGSDHKAGLLLGAGLQYDFTRNLAGRFEYEWLNIGSDTVLDRNNIGLFSLGLLYKF